MSNWKKWIFASDVHGSEQDVKANKAFFNFVKDYKPEIKIMGGDLFDFAALRKKASEEERRTSIKGDFEAGREWLLRYQPQHFLLGNHDIRLFKLAEESRGPLSDYAKTLVQWVEEDCRKLKCPLYPYDKRYGIVRIGNLKCLHGFATGIGAARKMAQVYGACVFGHGHACQFSSIEGLEDRTGRMAGCLCRLDLPYVEASLGSLMWRHGWVFGVVNEKSGNYQAWQAEEIEGKWTLPTGFKEY